MTFSNLRQTAFYSRHDALKEQALVFPRELAEALRQVEGLHRVIPRELVTGDFILNASVLKETYGERGLFRSTFNKAHTRLLNTARLLPWSEALSLLPPDPILEDDES